MNVNQMNVIQVIIMMILMTIETAILTLSMMYQILEAADRIQALEMKGRALDIIVTNFTKVFFFLTSEL